MIEKIVFLLLLIPIIGLVLYAQYRQYSFFADLFGLGKKDPKKDIAQIKKIYEGFSSEELFKLLQSGELSVKETLVINKILQEKKADQ